MSNVIKPIFVDQIWSMVIDGKSMRIMHDYEIDVYSLRTL